MATTYSTRNALSRAIYKARDTADSFTVYQNKLGDCMVRVSDAPPPKTFRKVFSVSCGPSVNEVYITFEPFDAWPNPSVWSA